MILNGSYSEHGVGGPSPSSARLPFRASWTRAGSGRPGTTDENRPRAWVLLILIFLGSPGCAPSDPSRDVDSYSVLGTQDPETPIAVHPSPVILGNLPPGRRADVTVRLENRGSNEILISWVETSCPCISGEGLPLRIAAHGAAALELVYRPEAPDFRGDLSVELSGLTEDREVAFRTKVNLSVR